MTGHEQLVLEKQLKEKSWIDWGQVDKKHAQELLQLLRNQLNQAYDDQADKK